jgi:protein-S-isoprenylcysteine O-methyltransferase Ste14
VNKRNGIVDLLYNIAVGSKKVRRILAPVGAVFFFAVICLIIFCSFQLDKLLGIPAFLSSRLSSLIAVPLIIAGLLMIGWPMFYFFRMKGTPVPFSPPPKLITNGPYAYSRNPMVTGIFILLFGLGCRWNSFSMVFLFTPVFIVLNAVEIKMIEEPELEKRLGKEYVEYKKRTPMFFPGIFRRG